ncbi:M23 family metallopeptidase [Arthrobacter russicus]|uniref:M23 family metallopeptidase n=1 Tax=Arthrobacter russicus TaxID=172040 RepID=UPI0031D981D7
MKILNRVSAAVVATALLAGGAVISAGPASAAVPLYLPFTAGSTYQVTQYPHLNQGPYNDGAMDLALPSGTPVLASAPGIVREAGQSSIWQEGISVMVDIGNNVCLQYLHLSGVNVSAGQQVSQAQQVGRSGNTGYSSGPHLHWNTVSCSSRQAVGSLNVVEYPGGVRNGQNVTSQNRPAVPNGQPNDTVVFQANTGSLFQVGPAGTSDLRLGVMPGTSPSIAKLANGQNVIAFQANTGSLFTTGAGGTKDWGFGMMAGTSPSVTAVGNDFQISAQANTGSLWTLGAGGTRDLRLGMMKDTSPSITTLANGATVTAFQANTGSLFTTGAGGTKDWGFGMMAGTSPSVTAVGNDFKLSAQANTGSLWTLGAGGAGDLRLGMMAGTSPSGGR